MFRLSILGLVLSSLFQTETSFAGLRKFNIPVKKRIQIQVQGQNNNYEKTLAAGTTSTYASLTASYFDGYYTYNRYAASFSEQSRIEQYILGQCSALQLIAVWDACQNNRGRSYAIINDSCSGNVVDFNPLTRTFSYISPIANKAPSTAGLRGVCQ